MHLNTFSNSCLQKQLQTNNTFTLNPITNHIRLRAIQTRVTATNSSLPVFFASICLPKWYAIITVCSKVRHPSAYAAATSDTPAPMMPSGVRPRWQTSSHSPKSEMHFKHVACYLYILCRRLGSTSISTVDTCSNVYMFKSASCQYRSYPKHRSFVMKSAITQELYCSILQNVMKRIHISKCKQQVLGGATGIRTDY